MFDLSQSVIQSVCSSFLNKTNKKLFIKRDDLIHPLVSGNKWRKLKFNVEYVLNQKLSGILTFGGAYSNHLLATASACHQMGLKSVGIVRGEELNSASNELLSACEKMGMQLEFVSRHSYALKSENYFLETLRTRFSNMHVVPEGGANYFGIVGCQEIVSECVNDFDRVFVAQGTTTTSCGIASTLSDSTVLDVVPVLRGFDSINEMKNLFTRTGFDADWTNSILSKVNVLDQFYFGGYGKFSVELLEFMQQFYSETKIPLDPIYTGKAMYALMHYCRMNPEKEESILFVHTGGIEGGRKLAEQFNKEFF
jgi:1-aminocyclopropane-1-carboxylate deaminase